jgi:hypothetical protein
VWQWLDISAPEGDTYLQIYNWTGWYINLYGFSSAPAWAMRTLSAKSFGWPVLDTAEADVVEVVEPTSITFVEHNITLTIWQEVSPEVIKNPSDTNVNLILQPNDWSVAWRWFTPFSIVGQGAWTTQVDLMDWDTGETYDTCTVTVEAPVFPTIEFVDWDTNINVWETWTLRFRYANATSFSSVESSQSARVTSLYSDEEYCYIDYEWVSAWETYIECVAWNWDMGVPAWVRVTVVWEQPENPVIELLSADTNIAVWEYWTARFTITNSGSQSVWVDDYNIVDSWAAWWVDQVYEYTYVWVSEWTTNVYVSARNDWWSATYPVAVTVGPAPALEPITAISQFSTDYRCNVWDTWNWNLWTVTPSENGDINSLSYSWSQWISFWWCDIVGGNTLIGQITREEAWDKTFQIQLQNWNTYEYTFHVSENIPVESFDEELGVGIEIPEWQRWQMQFTYTPTNATNFNGLSWTSSDIEVADVWGFWYNDWTLFQNIDWRSEWTCTITWSYNNVPFTTINVAVVPVVPYEISGLSEQSVTATVWVQRDVNVSGNSNANSFDAIQVTSSDDSVARAGFSRRIDSFGNSTLYIHPQSEWTCTITIDDWINSFDCDVTVEWPQEEPCLEWSQTLNPQFNPWSATLFFYACDTENLDWVAINDDTWDVYPLVIYNDYHYDQSTNCYAYVSDLPKWNYTFEIHSLGSTITTTWYIETNCDMFPCSDPDCPGYSICDNANFIEAYNPILRGSVSMKVMYEDWTDNYVSITWDRFMPTVELSWKYEWNEDIYWMFNSEWANITAFMMDSTENCNGWLGGNIPCYYEFTDEARDGINEFIDTRDREAFVSFIMNMESNKWIVPARIHNRIVCMTTDPDPSFMMSEAQDEEGNWWGISWQIWNWDHVESIIDGELAQNPGAYLLQSVLDGLTVQEFYTIMAWCEEWGIYKLIPAIFDKMSEILTSEPDAGMQDEAQALLATLQDYAQRGESILLDPNGWDDPEEPSYLEFQQTTNEWNWYIENNSNRESWVLLNILEPYTPHSSSDIVLDPHRTEDFSWTIQTAYIDQNWSGEYPFRIAVRMWGWNYSQLANGTKIATIWISSSWWDYLWIIDVYKNCYNCY